MTSSSLTTLPCFLGPTWHPRVRAAEALAGFLHMQGGTVETPALKAFYDARPGLSLGLAALTSSAGLARALSMRGGQRVNRLCFLCPARSLGEPAAPRRLKRQTWQPKALGLKAHQSLKSIRLDGCRGKSLTSSCEGSRDAHLLASNGSAAGSEGSGTWSGFSNSLTAFGQPPRARAKTSW